MKKGKRWRRTKSISLVLAGMLTMAGMPVMTAQASVSAPEMEQKGKVFYVSSQGREGATGTLEDPFGSLSAARDAVREFKENTGIPEGGITVNIRGGEYALLEDSFTLEARDSGTDKSPVTWRAYEGEEVKLAGNMTVDGSKFQFVTDEEILNRLPETVRDKVLVYDLAAENGLTSFSPIPKSGYGWPSQASSMSVLVDGETQTLARYPNQGFLTINEKNECGFVPRNHLANPDGSCPECTKIAGGSTRIPCKYKESEFAAQPGGVFTTYDQAVKDRFALWEKETDIWTAGYFCWDWADDNCGISKIEENESGVRFTMAQPSRYGVTGGANRFYAYNLLCEIDEPGEWYLDRENARLYLYPEKDISECGIELAMQTKPLVAMEGVSYVNWQGITFDKSNGHGVSMMDCDHVEVAGCTFRDLGQRAVCIGDPNESDINEGAHGGHDNTILSCDVVRTGQGGIFVGGGNRYALTPGNNRVINCDISDFATIKRTYSPAIELAGCGNAAERNEIYNAPHLAIQFKGNDMLIYGNDIHNVCYETADCGAIYSVRRWSWQGTVIKNNFIHDLVNTGGIGSAAVYVDDLGSGVTMTENLLVNIPGYTTLFGGGRDNVITNNIQINNGNGKGFEYDARGLGWAWYHAAGPDGECYGELMALRNHPAYEEEIWNAKYPGLASIDLNTVTVRTDKGDGYKNYYSVAARPAGAVIARNILVGVANSFGNVNDDVKSDGIWEEETNVAYEQGTAIGFANVDAYDFRVEENSQIHSMMGDAYFHVDQMGLYEDAYRHLDKKVLEAPVLVSPADKEADLIVTNGVKFQWNAVEGADAYRLEITTDENFASVYKSVTVEETTAIVTDLEKETNYYWRVIARERAVNGAVSVSEVRCFTTSSEEDNSFFEGFRGFSEWEVLVEGGTPKGSPSNTTKEAHSGRYSYELNEGMDVIRKIFGTKHNDVVRVWLYDNLNKGNGAAAMAQVTNGELGFIAAGVNVDMRNGARKEHYSVREGGTFYETEIVRTEGWHELQFDYSDGVSCVISIDGTVVHTVENAPYYDRILLGDFWNHAGYAGDISGMLFDDVTVGEPNIPENILKIGVKETDIKLLLGETYQLEAVVETDPDVDVELEYTSAEWEIAKVDETGLINAVRPGNTVIRIESVKNPSINMEVQVEVYVPVTGVVAGCSNIAVTEGTEFSVQAAVLPANATNKKVAWSSLDETVATVDAEGKVVAHKAGETVLVVTTEDGGFTDTCKVMVKTAESVSGGDVTGGDVTGGDAVVEKILLNTEKKTLKKGESFLLSAKVLPENAEDALLWYSSDTEVAVVKDGLVTAVGSGQATIVVTTARSGVIATCSITVEAEEDPKDPVIPEDPKDPVPPEDSKDTITPEDPTDQEQGSGSEKQEETKSASVIKENARTYVVVPGDTMQKIAHRNQMTLRELLALNPQIKNPNRIYPGQRIVVGKILQQKKANGQNNEYIVVRGDSLYKIAKRFDMTLKEIYEKNPGVRGQKYIYAGQHIFVTSKM